MLLKWRKETGTAHSKSSLCRGTYKDIPAGQLYPKLAHKAWINNNVLLKSIHKMYPRGSDQISKGITLGGEPTPPKSIYQYLVNKPYLNLLTKSVFICNFDHLFCFPGAGSWILQAKGTVFVVKRYGPSKTLGIGTVRRKSLLLVVCVWFKYNIKVHNMSC